MTTSTAPPTTPPTTPPRLPQRLVLCLDGTWNVRDDCTNVYHLSNLVREGEVGSGAERAMQLVHYQQGVGTGPLDRLTGGGFGFGLERNVRQAYDWLIENYHAGDQIYVFGFSRGAFTARSLVGLISRCGLLERAAPLTVNQLWAGYCILGRRQEQREGWWERLAGQPAPPFRALSDLAWDPWQGGKLKDGIVPANDTERLLVSHSRRVKIDFLGLFDTVGAVGWDALAIPGLRSKLAMQHNLRVSRILQRVFHALALDEHRSSFEHTPFVEYVSGDNPEGKQRREAWNARVRQRWFVGAHSSVGGGYPDNELALRPLAWMLEGDRERGFPGAKALGLVVEDLRTLPELRATRLPDSYARFTPPLWQHLLRAKRHQRTVGPEPEVRAGRRNGPAFSLASIGEELDPSVPRFAVENQGYAPPGLAGFAGRNPDALSGRLADRTSHAHRWLDGSLPSYAWTVLWAGLAGAGVVGLSRLFAHPVAPWVALPCALFLALVDWAESRLAFERALGPFGPARRALLELLFWHRAVGVVAAAAGLVFALSFTWMRAPAVSENAAIAGGLLLFELGGVALARGLDWAGAPLRRANLGGIVWLQLALSPTRRLESWRQRLTLQHGELGSIGEGPATQRLCALLREELWRDALGLLPLYAAVFAFALWFANAHTSVHWLGFLAEPAWGGARVWQLLLAATVLADLLENGAHLHHVARFERGAKLHPLAIVLGWIGSGLKWLDLAACSTCMGLVMVGASLGLPLGDASWRTVLARAGSLLLTVVLCAWVASVFVGWVRGRKPDDAAVATPSGPG